MSKHSAGTLIRFQIDHVTKAQFRFLELRFDRRLQVLDQVRHTTIYDWLSGWRRRRHGDPDVYRRPAFDLCSPRRDLPDHGAFALRRLLIADLTEAQLRSLDLRSDFLTPIFKQVWHSTQVHVTLGLLIDFQRHRDPDVNVGTASGFCSRSRRLLENGPASMQIGMCSDASGTGDGSWGIRLTVSTVLAGGRCAVGVWVGREVFGVFRDCATAWTRSPLQGGTSRSIPIAVGSQPRAACMAPVL